MDRIWLATTVTVAIVAIMFLLLIFIIGYFWYKKNYVKKQNAIISNTTFKFDLKDKKVYITRYYSLDIDLGIKKSKTYVLNASKLNEEYQINKNDTNLVKFFQLLNNPNSKLDKIVEQALTLSQKRYIIYQNFINDNEEKQLEPNRLLFVNFSLPNNGVLFANAVEVSSKKDYSVMLGYEDEVKTLVEAKRSLQTFVNTEKNHVKTFMFISSFFKKGYNSIHNPITSDEFIRTILVSELNRIPGLKFHYLSDGTFIGVIINPEEKFKTDDQSELKRMSEAFISHQFENIFDRITSTYGSEEIQHLFIATYWKQSNSLKFREVITTNLKIYSDLLLKVENKLHVKKISNISKLFESTKELFIESDFEEKKWSKDLYKWIDSQVLALESKQTIEQQKYKYQSGRTDNFMSPWLSLNELDTILKYAVLDYKQLLVPFVKQANKISKTHQGKIYLNLDLVFLTELKYHKFSFVDFVNSLNKNIIINIVFEEFKITKQVNSLASDFLYILEIFEERKIAVTIMGKPTTGLSSIISFFKPNLIILSKEYSKEIKSSYDYQKFISDIEKISNDNNSRLEIIESIEDK